MEFRKSMRKVGVARGREKHLVVLLARIVEETGWANKRSLKCSLSTPKTP